MNYVENINRSVSRFFSFMLAFLLGLIILSSNTHAQDDTTRDQLIGVWQHTNLKHFADDNLVRENNASEKSIVEFKADGTWRMESDRFKSSGNFRWIDQNTIETKIVESNIQAQIGNVKAKQVLIRGNTLELTVIYEGDEIPSKTNGARPQKVAIISTFERMSVN